MRWTEHYRVGVNDTDLSRTASASALMRYMQDTADLQMEGQRPSYLELFDCGYAFVLARFRLRCLAPLSSHDEITSETWATPSHGFLYGRCYRLLRDGEPVAEADAVWALINLETGRPTRVGEVPLGYTEDEPLDLSDLPPRVRIPGELPLTLVGEHTVTYAEADVNRHLNNTHYADLFCGYLPMEDRRVSSLLISFLAEAPLGETVKVYRGDLDGVSYFRTVRSDGTVNAEAAITLEEL